MKLPLVLGLAQLGWRGQLICTYRQAGGLEDLRGGFCGLVPCFLLRVSMVIEGRVGGAPAPAATDRPAAQLLLFATDRPRRHRPRKNAATASATLYSSHAIFLVPTLSSRHPAVGEA